MLKAKAAGAFTNIGRLTYYQDGEEDPYITLKEVFTVAKFTNTNEVFTVS
jgi:hypothetical protein